MELIYTTGCISEGLRVDNKDFIYSYKLEECKEIFNKVFDWCVENQNEKTRTLFKETIFDLMNLCNISTEEKELKYGDDDFESIMVVTLKTDKHCIRSFYDVNTDAIRLSVDIYDSDELTIKDLRNIIDEVVQIYYKKPLGIKEILKEDNNEIIKIFLQSQITNIIESQGVINHISEPCQCCGDIVYQYKIDL